MNNISPSKEQIVASRLKLVLNANNVLIPVRNKTASVEPSHLLWMLEMIINNPDNEDIEKLNRWIGWVQCAMSFVHNYIDAESERNETRPIFRGN